MKVILITNSNLGKIGDVVEVKNGYGKNYLIPNKKAIFFTDANNAKFVKQREEFEKVNQDKVKEATAAQSKLKDKTITIIENASDDGRLYGSINRKIIAKAINEFAAIETIIPEDINLKNPIKEIGVYDLLIAPCDEVSFAVSLVVSRNESEVKSLIEKAKAAIAEEKAKEKQEKEEKVKKVEAKKEEVSEESAPEPKSESAEEVAQEAQS